MLFDLQFTNSYRGRINELHSGNSFMSTHAKPFEPDQTPKKPEYMNCIIHSILFYIASA